MSDKLKKRYNTALNNVLTLENQLAMLCTYVTEKDVSRETIARLISVAWELVDPVIASIETWGEEEGLSNG